MKYANLSTQEKILKWFELNPQSINDKDEIKMHIFDWIYQGYRGSLKAKNSLLISLLNQGANLEGVTLETYKSILIYFFDNIEKNKLNHDLILKSIKSGSHFSSINKELFFYNQLIKKINPQTNIELEEKKSLLLNIQPEFTIQTKADDYNYAMNVHPVIHLLQDAIFQDQSYIWYKNIHLIDNLNRHSNDYLLSTLNFQYLENNYLFKLKMKAFNINSSLNCLQCIENVIQTKEQEYQGKYPHHYPEVVEAFNKMKMFEEMKHLSHHLPSKQMTNKLKI